MLTVGENFLRAHDHALFHECGIDPEWPIIYKGMYESDYAEKWAAQNKPGFDASIVEDSVVSVAKSLIAENPDIGMFVFECTSMPPYADAVRRATGVPVFDPVDMVKKVNVMVENQN